MDARTRTAVETFSTLARLRSHWDGMTAAGLAGAEREERFGAMFAALMGGNVAEANRIAEAAMGPEGLRVARERMAEFRALAEERLL